MQRMAYPAGMESDDDSELDDIVFPSSVPHKKSEPVKQEKPASSEPRISIPQTDEQGVKLYVGNLPEGCTDTELRELFGKHGVVSECNVLKRFGFVSMSSADEAENAIRGLHRHFFRGSFINVQVSNGSPNTPASQKRSSNSFRSNSRGGYQRNERFNTFTNQRTEAQASTSQVHHYSNYQNSNRPPKYIDSNSSEMLDDLRYAITTGNLETTKKLLSKGIWVDTILKAGWTGLMYASSSGHSDIVLHFLEKEADTNYHKDMYTPLMAVCASRKNEEDLLKCCSLLIKHGANVNAHERHLTTPLMFASREGYFNIVKELLQHGAKPNVQDNRGKTALALAAICGHGQIVRLLLENGADQSICDNMGQSPEDLAYENGHKEIVSILKKSLLPKHESDVEEPLNAPLKVGNGIITSSVLSVKSKNFSKVGELELFLQGIEFPELVKVFKEHDLSFHDLLIMDEGELEKIGINQVGVRKKILEACKVVHKKEWQNSSLPNLKQSQFISCADAVSMMANIAKHLKFISSSVIFLRQQIQSQPRILELAQDSANVHDLIDEMEDTLKNVHFLNDEVRFLKLHLEKIQDRIQYIPADLIVETVPINSQRKFFYITVSVVTTAVAGMCAVIIWKNPSILKSIPMSVRLKLPF